MRAEYVAGVVVMRKSRFGRRGLGSGRIAGAMEEVKARRVNTLLILLE
jgi:hypothetical protein